VTAWTSDHRCRRWGCRGTTCSCASPQSCGEAGGARTAAGEGALGPEAIAVGSGLKPVLDEEEAMAEQILCSNGDGKGQQRLTTVSRERSKGA
jgi:hypothetical protein